MINNYIVHRHHKHVTPLQAMHHAVPLTRLARRQYYSTTLLIGVLRTLFDSLTVSLAVTVKNFLDSQLEKSYKKIHKKQQLIKYITYP